MSKTSRLSVAWSHALLHVGWSQMAPTPPHETKHAKGRSINPWKPSSASLTDGPVDDLHDRFEWLIARLTNASKMEGDLQPTCRLRIPRAKNKLIGRVVVATSGRTPGLQGTARACPHQSALYPTELTIIVNKHHSIFTRG